LLPSAGIISYLFGTWVRDRTFIRLLERASSMPPAYLTQVIVT
jgi:hypothetical protein